MGCCSEKGISKGRETESDQVKLAIEKSQFKKITYLKKLMENAFKDQNVIDKGFIKSNGLVLSPLGYAMVLGKFRVFQFIHKLGASLLALEELLVGQGKSIFEIVCENGYNDIFKYLIEDSEYNPMLQSIITSEGALTLDFEQSKLYEKEENNNKNPIILAVELGYINIIDTCYKFMEIGKRSPYFINLHHIDDKTGENYGLIACKKGQYLLVKYLYKTCKADFHLMNKRSENALVITAYGSKKYRDERYLMVFVYLIEEVKVDYLSHYEEILMILEDKRIIRYFNKILFNSGIDPDKQNLEKKYKPSRCPSNPAVTSDQIPSHNSFASTIKQNHSILTENFTSFIFPETTPPSAHSQPQAKP